MSGRWVQAENAVGARVPRIELMDQNGELVDLYDFASTDAMVLIDISSMWCGACHTLSAYLAGAAGTWLEETHPNLPGIIEDGKLSWLTVLGEDRSRSRPDLADLQEWDGEYFNEKIPVLADDGRFSALIYGWPTLLLLSPDMTIAVTAGSPSGHWLAPLDAAHDIP